MVEEVETPPLQQEWYEPAELRDVRMEMKVTPSMEEQRQRERVNAPHGPEATKGSPKEPIKPLTPEIQELLTQISKSGLPKMMHGGQPLPMQASASSSQPQMQVQSMAPPSSIVYTPTTGLPLPIISMPATTMPAPQQLPWQHQHQQQHQGAQYDQMCQFFRTKRVSAVKGFLHSFLFSSLLFSLTSSSSSSSPSTWKKKKKMMKKKRKKKRPLSLSLSPPLPFVVSPTY